MLAFQIEPQTQLIGFTNLLYGAGINLDIPTTKYFTISYYRRDQDKRNSNIDDNNQITVTWRKDSGNFHFDGFLDIVDYADSTFGKKNLALTSHLRSNTTLIQCPA